MPFPQTFKELRDAGYRFDEHGTCRGEDCGAEIEWWITPKGKKMPFNLMSDGDSPAVSHHSTCPNADDFRRNR